MFVFWHVNYVYTKHFNNNVFFIQSLLQSHTMNLYVNIQTLVVCNICVIGKIVHAIFCNKKENKSYISINFEEGVRKINVRHIFFTILADN